MAILVWEKRFELGIAEFDGHHRRLVQLLNEVYRHAVQEESPENLERVLGELISYTGYHFAAEESAMQASGYQGLELHCDEHGKFREMAAAFEQELAAGLDISVDLLSFLGNWLFDHILTLDAELCASLGAGRSDS